MSLLSIKGLRAGYDQRDCAARHRPRHQRAQIQVVLGANGAGKTTLLRAISGTIERSGTIVFDGQRIDRLSARKVVARGVAHVPQGRGTFADLTRGRKSSPRRLSAQRGRSASKIANAG